MMENSFVSFFLFYAAFTLYLRQYLYVVSCVHLPLCIHSITNSIGESLDVETIALSTLAWMSLSTNSGSSAYVLSVEKGGNNMIYSWLTTTIESLCL